MSARSKVLLKKLAACKGSFGPAAARETIALLEQSKTARFRGAEELIEFHETVLYLRAYPQNPRVLKLADEILFSFGERMSKREREPFEYADVSGITRTGLTTNFSYPFAKSLAERQSTAFASTGINTGIRSGSRGRSLA